MPNKRVVRTTHAAGASSPPENGFKNRLLGEGTTNVAPSDLNYDRYSRTKYDSDIEKVIPGYGKLHNLISAFVSKEFSGRKISVLELGIGTGVTAEYVLGNCSCARYSGVDFSETMLDGARDRLMGHKVDFIRGDYSEIPFPGGNDLVVSVIGIHHQGTDEAKKRLFLKISESLNAGGVFVFGDLVTYRDEGTAALNDALHFHHLVSNAPDEESLKEWAHHHKFLNSPAPAEDQLEWLRDAGFSNVELVFSKFNTALIIAKK